MALFIEIKAADGLVSRTILAPGTNRFTVRLGDSYRIFDDQTGLTPQGIAVKRVDNDLLVDGLGVADTTVEFAAFYSVCSAGSPCELTVDSSSGGAPVAITPGTQPIGALADGSFVLYDPRFAETAPPAPATGDGTMVRNVLYGVGGLAVVGLAAGGGGGGGGDDGDGAAPAGTLKFTSSPLVNSRTPTLTGEAEPGSRVLVRIDTDGDGAPNVTYGTTVGTDSRWSVNLATAVPESGSLPAGGLPDSSIVGITSTTDAGVVSLPPFTLAFDGVPPAPAVIDAVATDNVVNAAERAGGVVISGSAEAGTTVTLTWGGQFKTAIADASGNWQTPTFDAASVPPDGTYTITAVAQDSAGNNSPDSVLGVSVNTASPPLAIARVAGADGRVGLAEANNVVFEGSTEPGANVSVLWNSFNNTTTSNAAGNWSVAFGSSQVPDSPGAEFDYTVTAINAVGNVASSPGKIFVDLSPPSAPTIATVAGNNIVSSAERLAGVVVAGTGAGATSVLVNWGGETANAPVDAAGNWQTTFTAANMPPDGSYSLSAVARDLVGNESAAAALPVSVITTPALLGVTSVAGGDNLVTVADGPSVAFNGTAEPGAQVNLLWNSVTNSTVANGAGSWSTVFPSPVADSVVFPYSVSTVNAVGNSAGLLGNVTVDNVAPTITIPSGLVVDPLALNVIVTGTVVGQVSVVTAHLDATPQVADDPPIIVGTEVSGEIWTATFAQSSIPPGPTTLPISVFATDSAGNVGQASSSIIVPASSGGGAAAISTSELIATDENDTFAGSRTGTGADFIVGASSTDLLTSIAPLPTNLPDQYV